MNKITIEINNINSRIIGELTPEIFLELKQALSYVVTGAQFSTYAQKGWDGTKYLFISRTQSFPTGLLRRVRAVLYKHNISYDIDDKRVKPTGFPLILKNVKLRDYQEDCIKEMTRVGRGLIQVGTSGGKGVIISGILANLGVNSLVIVPTRELLKQTSKVISDLLGIKVGIIGDGEKDIGKITVATFQSLTTSEDTKKRKYNDTTNRWAVVDGKKVAIRPDLKEYLDSLDCIFVDESHHLSAESLQQIFNACPNTYYRYGCSATPFHDNDTDVLIEAVTGRVLRKYSASYLIANKWISQPTIHLLQFKQERLPKGITYAKAYEERITNNAERNDLVRHLAEKAADENNSVLISVRQINHGEIIYDLLKDKYDDKVVFLNSKVASSKISEVLKKLSKKEVLIVIATSLINEGINVPSLDTLIFASCPKSPITTIQLVGRVLRRTETKTTVDVYDIQDYNCKFFGNASKERRDIYATEPEFILKEELQSALDNK